MATSNKYGAIKTYRTINGEQVYFDSSLEAYTYDRLRLLADATIEPQVPIIIKPKTAKFREKRLVVDFRITYKNVLYYVEAKGHFLDESQMKWQLLEYFQPQIFAKTIFVCYQQELEEKQARYKHYHWLSLPQIQPWFEGRNLLAL